LKNWQYRIRDIGEIIKRAIEEKERQEHKSLSVQDYELFSKGKTPLEVAIDLNIGEGPATQYYTEYLRLVQLDSVTQLNLELRGESSKGSKNEGTAGS
jgi:hypothetical protein